MGTGGASLYPFPTLQANSQVRNNTTWGVLKLTLHPTSYDWEFIPVAGQTFTDAGSANCTSASTIVPEAYLPLVRRDPSGPVAGQTFTDAGSANGVSAGPAPTATPTNPPAPTLPSPILIHE